jgi:hypothetical protein
MFERRRNENYHEIAIEKLEDKIDEEALDEGHEGDNVRSNRSEAGTCTREYTIYLYTTV